MVADIRFIKSDNQNCKHSSILNNTLTLHQNASVATTASTTTSTESPDLRPIRRYQVQNKSDGQQRNAGDGEHPASEFGLGAVAAVSHLRGSCCCCCDWQNVQLVGGGKMLQRGISRDDRRIGGHEIDRRLTLESEKLSLKTSSRSTSRRRRRGVGETRLKDSRGEHE